MEEDAGKSLHEGFRDSETRTYVDYNRSGVPLIEIVSEPDLRSAAEAAEFFTRLREILVSIGVNDGNMEEGSLRCDANVSVRPAGQEALGTKAEVKNVNSFRYLQKAIEYEIERQIDVVSKGGRVVQETRLFDSASGADALDAQQGRGARLPLLPGTGPAAARRRRPTVWAVCGRCCRSCPRRAAGGSSTSYGIPDYDAGVLTQSGLADYFEAVAGGAGNAKAASNWVMGELLRTLNERGTASGRRAAAAGSAGGTDRARRQGHDQQRHRQGHLPEDVRLGTVGRRHRRRRGAGAELRRVGACSRSCAA